MPRDYETALPAGTDHVALFAERVADYRATVHRTDAAGLTDAVAGILRGWGAKTLVVPDTASDPWLAAAPEIVVVRDEPPLSKAQLDAVDAVITDAAVGIAETGTIVLDARPEPGSSGPQPAARPPPVRRRRRPDRRDRARGPRGASTPGGR